MKVFLAFAERDFDPRAELPQNAGDLTQDLGLDIILDAMSGGDRFLRDIATHVLLASLKDVAAIRYRQSVLADCVAQPEMVRTLYALAVETLERERHIWGVMTTSPSSVLYHATEVMRQFVTQLRTLRALAVRYARDVRSPAFTRLFNEILAELDERYLDTMETQLKRLRFGEGVRLSARLRSGNLGTEYVLRRRARQPSLRERVGFGEADSHVYQLPDRDDAGAQALSDLRGEGIALAASALGSSSNHILDYFRQLCAELGFYVACLNLYQRVAALGGPTCLPEPVDSVEPVLAARGVRDLALCLASGQGVVGNDVAADGMALIMVTGANRGGKSTFLRSLGIAQLMMQAGMFVCADAFRAELRGWLFTHFRREEDVELEHGKFDEELVRMRAIIDVAAPDSIILMNESFASTNEREGSEIARQIVLALIEAGVKIVYVTHLFELAAGIRRNAFPNAQFLRAERLTDGTRTFRIVEGEPLPTSHGQDIYARVFGTPLHGAIASARLATRTSAAPRSASEAG